MRDVWCVMGGGANVLLVRVSALSREVAHGVGLGVKQHALRPTERPPVVREHALGRALLSRVAYEVLAQPVQKALWL